MVRLIGVLCIIAGACGFGTDNSRRIRHHYHRLLVWKECIWKIENRMVQFKLPLPEILSELEADEEEPFGTFFGSIRRELEKYESSSPGTVWRDKAKGYRKEFGWNKEEERLFYDCGKVTEPGNGQTLHQEAELFAQQIEYLIQKEQKEMTDKLRVSMYLCMSAGIFLVILLI